MKKSLSLTITLVMVILMAGVYADDVDSIDVTEVEGILEGNFTEYYESNEVIVGETVLDDSADEPVDYQITEEPIEAELQQFSLTSTQSVLTADNEQNIKAYSASLLERFDNTVLSEITWGNKPNGVLYSFPNAPEGSKQMNLIYPDSTVDKSFQIDLTNIAHSGASGNNLNKANYWFQHSMNDYNYIFGSTLRISLNFYVEYDSGSGSLMSGELRNDTTTPSQLFTIRTGGVLQFASSSAISASYSRNRWNNLTVLVDTYDKKFSAILNEEPLPNVTDIPLHNATLFEFGATGLFNFEGVRFACQPTTNKVIDSARFFIDDLFIGKEAWTSSYMPSFETAGTAGSNGTLKIVPIDLKTFKITFPMSVGSLENFVTLTQGKNKLPVNFTLKQNSTTEHTITLDDNVIPDTAYTLKIKSGSNITYDEDISFTVITEFDIYQCNPVEIHENALIAGNLPYDGGVNIFEFTPGINGVHTVAVQTKGYKKIEIYLSSELETPVYIFETDELACKLYTGQTYYIKITGDISNYTLKVAYAHDGFGGISPDNKVACIKGEDIVLTINRNNILDINNKTFTLIYDPNYLELTDCVGQTYKKDLTPGKIEDSEITIAKLEPNELQFSVNENISFNTGIINIIKFKAKKTGLAQLTFSFN